MSAAKTVDDDAVEMPDIGEMIEVMRAVVAASDALHRAKFGGILLATGRLDTAIHRQRELLAEIDALSSQEFSA